MSVPAPVSRNHKPNNRKQLKQQVWERDGGICQLCARSIPICQQTNLDRIIPRVRGGRYTLDNVQASCRPCNARKGDAQVRRFAYASQDRLFELFAAGIIEWDESEAQWMMAMAN